MIETPIADNRHGDKALQPNHYPPPDTDPEATDALWNTVRTLYSSEFEAKMTAPNIQSADPKLFFSSPALDFHFSIPALDLFSSPSFDLALEQHGVEILGDEDSVQSQFWIGMRQRVAIDTQGTSASRESGTMAWRDKSLGGEELRKKIAMEVTKKVMSEDGFYSFYTLMTTEVFLDGLAIAAAFPLSISPVRQFNKPSMFNVTSPGYELPPKIKSIVVTTPFTPNKETKIPEPGTTTTTSRKGGVSLVRTSSRSTNPNTGRVYSASTIPALQMSKNAFDFAYWIDVKAFAHTPARIAQKTFVTEGRGSSSQKTSPYLSVAVDEEALEKKTSKLGVRRKLAVYGSTALYNRYKLRMNAATKKRGEHSNDSSHVLLHFGVTLFGDQVDIWAFECKDGRLKEWSGCTMRCVAGGSVKHHDQLLEISQYLATIHEWGMFTHVQSLREDLGALLAL